MTEQLTHERLREILDYDPETGYFTRKESSSNVHAGDRAGTNDGQGYLRIRLCGGRMAIRAHRLAWFYVTGEWPSGQIDHINGIRNDNRFVNLREATPRMNSQNIHSARSDNRSGLRGVIVKPGVKQFAATIHVGGIQLRIGRYATKEEAHAAYLRAQSVLHRFASPDARLDDDELASIELTNGQRLDIRAPWKLPV